MTTEHKKQYWAFRTYKEHPKTIYDEIQKNRLRQGWGYDQEQDLRKIDTIRKFNEEWKKKLSDPQKEALKNLVMLADPTEYRMQIGDIILVPNMPEWGHFCLVRITGEYYFDMMELPKGDGKDIGHILPVELLTPGGVNNFNELVDARIRRSFRSQHRIWSLNGYAEHIEKILKAQSSGNMDLKSYEDSASRLTQAKAAALKNSRDHLKKSMKQALEARFKNEEWEEPIAQMLERLYPEAEVQRTGGVKEHGADIVVDIPNYLGVRTTNEDPNHRDLNDLTFFRMIIQVKNYGGELSESHPLEQLQQAIQYWGAEETIVSASVITTAKTVAPVVEKERKALENKFGLPVSIITRDTLLDMMTNTLLLAAD